MPHRPKRLPARLVRFVVVLTLAVTALALAPRKALADVMICDASGNCARLGTNLGLGCSAFQPLPDGLICFLVGAVMAPDTHLQGDGSGGAVVVLNGRPHALLFPTPAAQATFKNTIEKGRAGGTDKAKASKEFQLALNQLFLSSGRKVSDDNLVKLSKEMKVPLAKALPKR